MKTNRLVVTIILVFMLLLTNSNIALAQSIPEVELVEQSDPGVVQVVRVYYESIEDIELLVPFDLFEYNNLEEKYVLVAVNARELGELKDLGFKVVIDEEETAKFTFLPSSGENQLNTIPSFPCYRTVEETYAAAAALAVNYPNLATWIDVGESWQKAIGPLPGYDMMVLKLTNSAIVGQKPVLFITASIHAREYAPAEIATRFAEYLVNNYGIDPDVTWMLDYQEVHIMFHANPDGRKIAETGSSWRKNRDNDDGCSTTYGVDLNRNFTYQWGTGGSSTNPCDETYRGPSAGSEPETQAIQAYISSVFIDQRGTGAAPADAQGVYIDIHSSGGYVMWPWGYTTTTPPNNTQLQTMGRKLAYFNGYTPGQITRVLYVASGGSVDYAYGEMGVATYAFEVGTAFFQACSSFESTVYPTNLNALLYATKVTRTPYMTPLGPDSLSLALSASTVPAGTSVTLTATANDTRYKSGTGEATQAIAAAEYYVDTPPWVTGATAFPMGASDGSFNSTTENITATLNTTGWSQGRHTLYIRSRDAAGNWGAVSAVFLSVIVTDNEPPSADDQDISTLEDTDVSIVLSGSDPDEDPLTFSVVDGPASGTLGGTAPDLTYTPNANYNGSDSFIYKANDGIADSELATVSITITPVNDAPVAQNQTVSTEVNLPLAIELAGLDVDGDSLTFTVLTDPEYGSLSGTAPSLQYTPVAGYTGSDSFTYLVNDGELESEIATISITITPPGPVQVFWDDFGSDLGWVVDPNDNDTATIGMWERANPENTISDGSVMQLGETVSGTHDLVTGYLAGSSVGSYDVDSGDTTILSPEISLPAGRELALSFYYYMAHLNNATADDYLRVSVLGETSQLVFEELGGANTDVATWESFSADISNFSGQTIRLLIEAADSGTASLVEAAIDDVLIQGLMTNNPPSADSQSVVTDEDMAVGVTLSGSDPEGAPLTYTVVTQPLHGDVSGTAPELTYTPDANYNGPDSFTFNVNDGEADSNTATVTITVTPVNDAPIANDQSVSTAEDTAKAITLAGIDVDGNPLTYAIITQPPHGSLSGDVPNVTYTPTANFNGSDSFTFKVNDGSVDSNIATVSITVTAVNDAPVADSQSVETAEDTATLITLTGSDIESSSLTFTIVNQPVNGTLSGSAPNVTYTPTADYNGSDSFTFRVSDGQTNSATATVNISITPVNDAPVATPLNVGTTQDAPVSITLSGSDIDADPLTYAVSTSPTNGTLSGTAPNLTYTPDLGYVGADSFEFTVSDGTTTSSPATVSISVSNINDAPVANGQSLSTPEDTSLSITLTGSDPDGDPLTYSIVNQPVNGTLSGIAPNMTYTPSANYHGSDSFTFKVNDGTVDSNTATVTITVTPVNDAPVAEEQSVSTTEDAAKTIVLVGTDADGDAMTYSIVTGPSHGSLSGTGSIKTYTPAANFNGSDSFTFKVNDGTVDSNTATVTITVTPVNDAPVAADESVSTAEDASKAITLSGSDADHDPITYRVITLPAHGSLTGTAPALTYAPEANYNGTDSFTFVTNDGTIDSVPATVTIDITPVNDAPIANGQAVVTSENTAVEITLTGIDVENSALTFSIESGPSNGTLTGSGAARTYQPAAGYEGEDSFTFIANDGELNSEPATVSITITRTNEPPVANGQTVTTGEDVALGVTLTGSDPDNDPITYVVSADPSHGTLSGTAPNLTYTPDGNYHGPDSFSFVVNDGLVDSAEATIAITVLSVNDAPVAEPQSLTVVEDTALGIMLTGTDIDGNPLTYTIVAEPAHGNLTGTGSSRTYTPAANYSGTDSFTFKVNDGTIDSNIAAVTVSVAAVNDAPVADSQSVNTPEDIALEIILTGSDVEANPLTYSIITPPAHGTLSGNGPNVTYTPAANYNGSDSFIFKVNDGQTDSATATVSISITPVNDAPIAIPQTLSVDEDSSLNVVLSGSDVDEDSLTFTLIAGPTHGTLSGTGRNLVYTPGLNFNGEDSFTFSVSDGTLVSATAVISISVRPVNDLPVAVGQAITTSENSPIAITLIGSDIEGDNLDYIINDEPDHGVLAGDMPNLIYTPDDYYSGNDIFSFYVNDGNSNSNSADVTILILDVNFLPIVYNQTISTSENTPLGIILTGMDPDGDVISFFTKVQPQHGSLSGTAPNLVYTPDPGYTGSDSFTFAASDQVGESNAGVISIQVTPSGPLNVFFDDFETDLGWVRNPYGTDNATLGYFERANPESVIYNGDKQLGTTVSGSYDLVTGPLAGSSAGAYDLDGGKTSFLSPLIELPNGRDLEMSFNYYLSHYTNSSTADYLRVSLIGETTLKVFEELGANNDDDAVWATFNGDISSFAGQTIRILIEAADASTASYFEAAVDDVGIIATNPNNPPLAAGNSYELAEDTNINITLAGYDPDGNPITFRIGTPPLHGSLTGTLPNLVYTPANNYNGSDSFTFVVNDGKLDSAAASISLNITAVNDVPIAVGQTVNTQVDTRLDVLLSGSDIDGDALQFNITSFPAHGILDGFIPNLVYIPMDGYIGADSFTFVVFDGTAESLPATVSITVNPAGPQTIFWDDFETNQGWVVNPNGVDTATSGTWVRANPETVSYYGYKQLGTTLSGSYDLVTGPLAGSSSGSYDLDGGLTSIRSPQITLPVGRELTLSFSYYLAHYTNSSTADYLRIKIVGSTISTLLQELGANNDDDASWQTFSVSLNNFAGQTVYLLIEAADASKASLVEAAIDDVLIVAE